MNKHLTSKDEFRIFTPTYFWQEAHSSEIPSQTYEITPYPTKLTKHGQELPHKNKP